MVDPSIAKQRRATRITRSTSRALAIALGLGLGLAAGAASAAEHVLATSPASSAPAYRIAQALSRPASPLPTRTPEWEENFDASVAIGPAAGQGTDYAILSAQTLQSMALATERYARIAADGGWPMVPTDRILRLGVTHPNVAVLRRRLLAEGDLQVQAGRAEVFDSFVAAAVRRFQQRHGLNADGSVGEATFEALNVPAAERVQQLRINAARLRSFAVDLPERYVLVNVPGQEVEAVEGAIAVQRHVAIVGKPDRQTPLLAAKIHELNFSPYWTIPRSIIRRDVIPQVRKDPGYLQRYVIRIFTQQGEEVDPATIDWSGEEAMRYVFRQDPGEDLNALGAVKLNFYNPYAVFLHDTPQKQLFAKDYRAFSSGCVRVQNIEPLLLWLLNGSEAEPWTRAKLDELIRSGERVDVKLTQKVPIYMVYVTAWATPAGTVNFRKDLYDRDGTEETAALATY